MKNKKPFSSFGIRILKKSISRDTAKNATTIIERGVPIEMGIFVSTCAHLTECCHKDGISSITLLTLPESKVYSFSLGALPTEETYTEI